MSQRPTTRRRLLVVVGLALLVSLSGCSTIPGADILDGGGSETPAPNASGSDATDGATGSPSASNGTAPQSTADASGTPGAGTPATGTPPPLVENPPGITGPENIEDPLPGEDSQYTDPGGIPLGSGGSSPAVDSLTISLDERITSDGREIVSNRTVMVDYGAGRAFANSTQQFRGDRRDTVETAMFANGTEAFVRQGFPNVDAYLYEYRNGSSVDSVADSASIDQRFDFDRSQTASGDTLLTADSIDQITDQGAFGGDVQSVSVRAVVDDETGVLLQMDYHVETTGPDGETIVHDLTREVTGLGSTTVSEPAWLDTARRRTGQS
jgi:hypothetical protein